MDPRKGNTTNTTKSEYFPMSTATASPWATKVNNKEGGNYQSPPAGTHGAVCIGVIDLGTHDDTYQGETKTQHKIFLAWELTNEQNNDGENFIVGQEYTWSLGKKAKLRGLIEGWIGKQFGDDEEFEIVGLIGKSCCLTLVEANSASGYVNTKINQVGSPMKGFNIPQAKTSSFAYHISESTTSDVEPPIPGWVPFTYGKPIKEKIMESPEWLNRSPF